MIFADQQPWFGQFGLYGGAEVWLLSAPLTPPHLAFSLQTRGEMRKNHRLVSGFGNQVVRGREEV